MKLLSPPALLTTAIPAGIGAAVVPRLLPGQVPGWLG